MNGAKLTGISANIQASIDEIQNAFDHDKEQVKEFKAIVEKSPKPLDQGLSEELNHNKEASESNVTLHIANQVLTVCFQWDLSIVSYKMIHLNVIEFAFTTLDFILCKKTQIVKSIMIWFLSAD